MATQYEAPSHTIPPAPPPGPGAEGYRGRGVSNASMNKYHPDNYSTPQPGSYPEQSGSYFPIPQRARGPSVGGQAISSTPPQANSYPGYNNGFLQSVYTPGANSAYQTPGPYTPSTGPPAPPYPQAVNELRPPEQSRRRSDASTHSRHSHHSHHSHRSGSRRSDSRDRSNRRRRSYDDDYDDEEEARERRHREHRERRASAPGHDHKDTLTRTRTRPTLGDTVYSSFKNIKYWLGPRDKY